MTKREPWVTPPVHPAAALLPMMGDEELRELADDIKRNGLLEPIKLWRDNTAEAKGSDEDGQLYILDGRNRWAALQLLGYTDPSLAPKGKEVDSTVQVLAAMKEYFHSSGKGGKIWQPWINPVTYVLSRNVHRRHLTSEQKRQAIAAYLKAEPTTSDRKVAKIWASITRRRARCAPTWRHVGKFPTSPPAPTQPGASSLRPGASRGRHLHRSRRRSQSRSTSRSPSPRCQRQSTTPTPPD
jgi:hypothetical protein